MAKQLQKLELTWIGKGDEPKLEPRILIEDPEKSYWAGKEQGKPAPWKSQDYDANSLNYDLNDGMKTKINEKDKNHSPSNNHINHSSDNCNMLIHPRRQPPGPESPGTKLCRKNKMYLHRPAL